MISKELSLYHPQLFWVVEGFMVPAIQQIDVSSYCICCEECQSELKSNMQRFQSNESNIDLNVLLEYCFCNKISSLEGEQYPTEEVRHFPRKRKGLNVYADYLLNKFDSLMKSLNAIIDPSRILITESSKLPYSVRTSNRRSRYIGVFKNGEKWQALISIKKKKTYIATFDSDLEAAKAYDLLSIILNKYLATTNFDYCKDDILNLFERYAFIIDSLNETFDE